MTTQLAKTRRELEQQAHALLKQSARPERGSGGVRAADYTIEHIARELWRVIQEHNAELPEDAYYRFELRIPPDHIDADLALQLFRLAEEGGEEARAMAEALAAIINETEDLSYIAGASVEGPFCNIILQRERVYHDVLTRVGELQSRYGNTDEGEEKRAIIEYSSPNIAKPIGVGHLRSTIIGEALANIYEASGAAVIRDNYLGDWGAQFGKLLYAYHEWGDAEKIDADPIGELKALYVRFHEEAEQQPELEKHAAELSYRLEEGDEELVPLWRDIKEWSVREFERIYETLGVTFDIYSGESYFVDKAHDVVRHCLDRGVCERSEESAGAIIVPEPDGLPTLLLQRSDGTTLYQTRELALLDFRQRVFEPDMIRVVVGNEQELYFRQLKAVAHKLGYLSDSLDFAHVGFGMVLDEHGKRMSTRRGTAVSLAELIDQATNKARAIVTEKNPDITGDELERVARTVGIGAILYNDLRQSRTRNISFDWERMLDLEGESAAYLQYTVVRLRSIRRTVAAEADGMPDTPGQFTFEHDLEWQLARAIMLYPYSVMAAYRTDNPHMIATSIENLAQQVNTFYNTVAVRTTQDASLKASRLALIEACAQVIENGLALLNIAVPDRM